MTEVIFKNQNKQKKRTQRIAGYVKQVVHVNEAVTSSEIMRRLVESEDIIPSRIPRSVNQLSHKLRAHSDFAMESLNAGYNVWRRLK